MPFNVGDSVYVLSPDPIRRGQLVRIEQVLPKKLSVQDFQEYVVEFPDPVSEQFRFCLYREFELENIAAHELRQVQPAESMKPEEQMGPSALKKSNGVISPHILRKFDAGNRREKRPDS